LDNQPKNPGDARNKNVLVVGGSGSGKTRFFVKLNLMQMHSSYVVTDPKGIVSKGQITQSAENTGSQPICGTNGRKQSGFNRTERRFSAQQNQPIPQRNIERSR
jgi:energy-coupling factor transporter ATP-binding protein EcfA2